MTSPTLSRRALIAGAGTTIASAALAVPYASAARSTEVCALPLDPTARFDAAAAEFMAAAEALRPGLADWTINVTDTAVMAFACREATFAGPGVYEVEMRDFEGKATRPIVALSVSTGQDGYWWQQYWVSQSRCVGAVHRSRTSELRIIRKIKSFA